LNGALIEFFRSRAYPRSPLPFSFPLCPLFFVHFDARIRARPSLDENSGPKPFFPTPMNTAPKNPNLPAGHRSRLRRALPVLPLACALLGGTLPSITNAQSAVTSAEQGSGVITGRVANSGTGQYLPNAVVIVNGTKLEARTSEDGYFRISGLNAGSYTVTAAYSGLEAETKTIVIGSGENQTVDFGLTSDIYMLGEFVVSSEREGSARATQEQREATNIKSIVAADSFGNMVDGNIGELMKNLPGVTIDYDGEDASEMRIRGMDPSLASVTMDGNPFATSPGSDSRAFSLRDLAVQNIETIEVNFAPTPEQPGNSMGGSINFKTKSAFNQKGRRIRLDANMSLNSAALDFQKTPGGGRTPDRKLMPGFNLSYVEAFGTKRPIGVALTASFAQRYRFNDQYRVGGYTYNQSDLIANGGIATKDMQGTIPSVFWTERGQADERRFVSLNLDYKLSDSTSLFLYNSVTRDRGLGSYTHNLTVRAGTQPADASFDKFVSPSGTTINPSVSVNSNKTNGFSINPGVKHRFGDFELTYDGYLSRSNYAPDKDRNYSVSYNVEPGTGLIIDGVSGNATGQLTQTAGADYLDIANYQSLSLNQDYQSGEDQQMGAKINARLPITLLGMPIQLQAGGAYNEQTRELHRYYRHWLLTGNSGSGLFGTAAEPNLQQFADPYFGDQWKFDVPVPNWISPYLVYDYFEANPDKFYNNYLTGYRASNRNDLITGSFSREQYGNRTSKEQIYAGYGMASIKVIPTVTVLAGARYEFTKLTATGIQYDSSNTAFFEAGDKFDSITPTSPYFGMSDLELASLLYTPKIGHKSYDKVFPNLQVRYEPIKNLLFRAAFTTNIGRPDFGSVMPGDNIYDHYNLIRRNNTKLRPQTGENIDINLEYYLPRSGVASVTFFHQKIKDYIYDVVTTEMIYNPDVGFDEIWTVETKENAGKASNQGVQFEYKQKLGFITSSLRDVEFRLSGTIADPKAQYLRRTGLPVYVDAPLPDDPAYPQYIADVDAYMNSPQEWTTIPLANVIKKSANVRLSYNGRLFTASVAAFWRDKFARSLNLTTLDHNYQQSDLRCDLSVGYKISSRWNAYFDWRNFTDEADDRRIFDRTGGFYTSGMAMNLGIRANF